MIENLNWVLSTIKSCTNVEQLKTCENIIGSFKFRLMKDKATDAEIRDCENILLEAYVAQESLFVIPLPLAYHNIEEKTQ